MKLSSSQQYTLLAATIFLVLAYLLPNFTQPWLSFYREIMAYGFVFFLYWTAFPLFGKGISVPRNLWVIGLCLLIVMGQYVAGMFLYSDDLFLVTAFLISIALAFICGATFSTSSTQTVWIVLCSALLGIAIFSIFLALIQWSGIGDLIGLFIFFIMDAPVGGRIVANMAQPNHLATLLVMGFAASIYLFKQQKISLVLLLLCTTLLAIVSAFTGSNTGLLSTVSVTAFILFTSWKTNSQNRGIIWVTLYWCSLTLLAFASLDEIKSFLLLSDSTRTLGSATGVRVLIYQKIWHALSIKPWMGYGWTNTISAVRTGAEYIPGEETVTYSHNLLFDILVWNGIPLGLVIIGALLYWGINRYFVRVNQETFLICAITLPFWIHSMTEFPFAYAYFSLPIAVLCGHIDAASRPQKSYLCILNKKIISLLVLFSVILGGFATHAYYMAEKQFLSVRLLNTGIVQPESYQEKKISLFNQLDDLIKACIIIPKKDMSTEDSLLLKKTSLRFPSSLIEARYLLSLLLTKQYDLYRHELVSTKNTHSAAYSYEFNQYIVNNPDVPEDMKKETTKILQEKITEFQLQQNKISILN